MLDVDNITPGSMHVITGGMKGFKTPQFIYVFDQLKYAGRPAQAFKPRCDYREEMFEKYGVSRDHILSRTGLSLPATEFDDEDPEDILKKLDPKVEVVGIEESTLVQHPDRLVEIVLGLREEGKGVIVSGLDINFRTEPFHPIPTFMAYATTVQKSYGTCDITHCKSKGQFPQRIINGEPAHYDSPIIAVEGAKEAYEIRCLPHHELPGKP